MTFVDLFMLAVLFFSGYVFINEKGIKKGGIYLLAFLCIGSLIGFISSYSNTMGKSLVIFLILFIGFLWNNKKGRK